jgi:hypothetical protein
MGVEMPELAERRSQYFAILDGHEAHDGKRDHAAQARTFWLAELAELLSERLRERLRTAGKLSEDVGLLVSNAGFIPETTILMAWAFRPRRVIVISSGEAYDSVDVIGDYLHQRGLRLRDFQHERCNPTDLSLFEAVRRAVEAHRQDKEGGEVLIDVTGGKTPRRPSPAP